MALIGINQPQQRREKESTLDKVAKIAQIGQAVLGSGFKIAEWMRSGEQFKAEQAGKTEDREIDRGVAYGGLAKAGITESFPEEKTETLPAQPLDLRSDEQKYSLADKVAPRYSLGGPPPGITEMPSTDITTTGYPEGSRKVAGQGDRMFTYKDPTDGLPGTSFKIDRDAAIRNFAKGLKYVRRGNELAVVPEAQIGADETAIEDIYEWGRNAADINRDQAERKVLRSEGGLSHTEETYKKEDWQDTFEKVQDEWVSIQKRLAEPIEDLKSAAKMLQNPNRVTAGAVKGFLVRYIAREKGVLTDKDLARTIPGSLPETVRELWRWLNGDENNVIPENIVEAMRETVQVARNMAKETLAFGAYDTLALRASAYPDFFNDEKVKSWARHVEVMAPGFRSAGHIRTLQKMMIEEKDPAVDAQHQKRINKIMQMEGWE